MLKDNVSDADLLKLSHGRLGVKEYEKCDAVTDALDPPSFCVLLSGSVTLRSGSSTIKVSQGGFFGEECLTCGEFSPEKFPYTVSALTRCTLVSFSPSAIEELVAKFPRISGDIIQRRHMRKTSCGINALHDLVLRQAELIAQQDARINVLEKALASSGQSGPESRISRHLWTAPAAGSDSTPSPHPAGSKLVVSTPTSTPSRVFEDARGGITTPDSKVSIARNPSGQKMRL